MKETETQLSKRIRTALEDAGFWVERIPSGPIPTRGGFVHGASSGTPDLHLVALGAWLEVKLPGKDPSEVQLKWHALAAKAGVRVAVVTSVEQALQIAKEWSA